MTGWDDQITTTKSATATAPFRIPITYTAVKVWDDDDNAAGRRPSGQYFHINYSDAAGSHSGGHTMTAAEATVGDNNWTYSWSDLGRERSYSVYENTSDDIFRDHIIEGTRNYGEDEYGRFVEYDVWWYARVRSVYDSETHTWTITNQYRERHVKLYEIPFAVPAANASANKTTEYDYSYRFSNRMSRNDRALNILRRGEDVVISYNVSGTADTIAYSRGNGMTGDRLVDYGRREVTLQMEDNYFDHIFGGGVNNSLLLDNSLRMTPDDAEIAYVTLNRPGFAQYGQWGTNAPAGTPQQDWIFYGWTYKSFTPSVVPVEILYGYQNGAWVEFARITTENGSTRVTPSNGATVASGTYNVNLPAGVERVRTELTVPSADSADQTSWANRIDSATMGYTVGVRLLADSDTIQQRLEAVFAQNDYGMCTLDNFVTLNLIDDQDHMFRSETAQSRAYLHGRNHRVAVRQEKVFELIENDLFNQQLLLHSTVTMTQQSNILERDEYWDAREEGLIPSTTSGTWYDLLPVGIMPDIDSVRLTSGDRITDIYTIENYRETGRVMLVVKAELTP
ncbi:MAG: Cna B-type domain-containing protein, partial [Lachnospiraceae bacterium]|nr:Cna B-type domain-containing protein [Lachnospiraceae bacterium]